MTILYDADTVEIYCGMNLVAAHDRSDVPYVYVVKQKCTTANIVIYSDTSFFYYQKFFC